MKKANVTHLNYKGNQHDISKFSYYDLFDQLTDGILIINSTGRVEYVNPSYEKMLSVSNFALVGKSIYHIPNDDIILTSINNKKKVQGYLNQPIQSKKISVATSIITVENQYNGIMAVYREEAIQEGVLNMVHLKEQEKDTLDPAFSTIKGSSSLLQRALQMASRAAKTLSTILIIGESGTGKELVAKAIHEASPKKNGPFVKVNCGAIPANLLESELFGYEQGAFTGAIKKRVGKFEQANGGTILLDEIGDMPLEMQVKLLRVIQEKEIERIGGSETIYCNTRIIAATHRNLEMLVQEGSFREDLYYRLNVIPIQLPSLKERKEDILDLGDLFINKVSKKMNLEIKTISEEVKKVFALYDWPGNIREMENLIERLSVLTVENEITLNDLPSNMSRLYNINCNFNDKKSLINLKTNGDIATMEEYEKAIIQAALTQFASFNAAGKALGMSHKTVAFKARKYNLVD